MAHGAFGLLGECYQALDEGLPLVGVLGVLNTRDGSRACSAAELQQLQPSIAQETAGSLEGDQEDQLRGRGGSAGIGNGGDLQCVEKDRNARLKGLLEGLRRGHVKGNGSVALDHAHAAHSSSSSSSSRFAGTEPAVGPPSCELSAEGLQGTSAGASVQGTGTAGFVGPAGDGAIGAKGRQGGSESPGQHAAGGSQDKDDEFEVWMQLVSPEAWERHALPVIAYVFAIEVDCMLFQGRGSPCLYCSILSTGGKAHKNAKCNC
jgi:hypothetical protein